MATDWGSVLSGVSSLVGAAQTNKAESSATDAYANALSALSSVTSPSVTDLAANLQDYVLTGEITPEEYTAYLQEQSEMEGITIPKEVLDAQYDSLNQLKEIADNGGLDATDKAKLSDIKTTLQSTVAGQRGADQNEYASRGMAGSGLELASRLSGESAAIQAAAKQGTDVAAQAQQRALDAIKDQASQANSMRTQDFNEQSAKAQAQDAINKFNTGQLQSTSNNNVTAANNAQAANLEAQQKVSDQNTAVANQNATNKANATQTSYTDQLNKANSLAGQYNKIGSNDLASAERTENQYSNIASTIGDAFDNYKKKNTKTDATASDIRVKTNVKDLSDDEIDEILDQLTGKQFKYAKRFKNDPETKVGVMAQDLEKSPLGANMVKEIDGVKHIDNSKATMLALAALANQHKRIKKLEAK